MFSLGSDRFLVAPTRKNKINLLGNQMSVKKVVLIFFFMEILIPKQHPQYHHSGGHHESVPETGKFLL